MHNAKKTEFKKFNAASLKIGIVVAQFNSDVTEAMLDDAVLTLRSYNNKQPEIFKVAGSIEIPLILSKLAATKRYDCLVALGTVIRGETAHFDYVCKMVSEGILRIMLDFGIPVGFGILTTDNLQQAEARIKAGGGAVIAALQSAKIIKEMKEKKS